MRHFSRFKKYFKRPQFYMFSIFSYSSNGNTSFERIATVYYVSHFIKYSLMKYGRTDSED